MISKLNISPAPAPSAHINYRLNLIKLTTWRIVITKHQQRVYTGLTTSKLVEGVVFAKS